MPNITNRWLTEGGRREGQFSLSPHSDHSSMTYSAPDGVPGLEVMVAIRQWIEYGKTRSARQFVVNTGEFLQPLDQCRFIANAATAWYLPQKDPPMLLTFFLQTGNGRRRRQSFPFLASEPARNRNTNRGLFIHEFFVTYMDGRLTSIAPQKMDED